MKQNILIISGGMNAGGAEKWLLDFAKRVDKSKFKLGFIFHTMEKQFFEDELIQTGSEIHRINGYKNIFKYLYEINLLVKKNNYRIIHCHVNHFSGVIVFLKLFNRKLKIIVHSHNDLDYKYEQSGKIKKVYFRLCEFLIQEHADFLIGVSDKASLSLFGNKIKSDKFKNIFCGIDTLDIQKKLKDSESNNYSFSSEYLQTKLSLQQLKKENKKIVFHIGRFVEQKNHKFMFEMISKAKNSNSNIVFCLFGTGPLFQKYTILKDQLDLSNCFLFGAVENITSLLKNYADLFILPSHHEGLPIVLMETQYTNVSSIISENITDECVIDNSLITFLSIEDSSIWLTKIEKIISETNTDPLLNSNFLGSKFDIETSVTAITKIYKKL